MHHGLKLVFILFLSLYNPINLLSQKVPLDIDACMSWNRVDGQEISPTGRWVTYRISQMEYNPNSISKPVAYLYDTKTDKQFELSASNKITFFESDNMLYYHDTNEEGDEETILMSLPSMSKSKWNYDEPFNPIDDSNYSISLYRVKEDSVSNTPAFDRLVIRNYKTGEPSYIDNIGYYSLYNKGKNIVFINKHEEGNSLCYGPIIGPYKTVFKSSIANQPTYFTFNSESFNGEFSIKDSLWYNYSIKKNSSDLIFDRKSIDIPEGMNIERINMSRSQKLLSLELKELISDKPLDNKEELKIDDSFELELWTWNEYEVPTLQTNSRYRQRNFEKYIYNISTERLTKVAPATSTLFVPEESDDLNYVLYSDDTSYLLQKEWLENVPFDIYSVNIHTGETNKIGESYRQNPKWAMNGKWAVMYDPVAQVWNKFDGKTGELIDISSAIGFPVHSESYDRPAPAPAYGIAGWTADGNNVFIYDAYDWWKIDFTGKKSPECFTKGYGRKTNNVIRKVVSNIDKDIFRPQDKIAVNITNLNTMDEGLYNLEMNGKLVKLIDGPYKFTVYRFSDNQEYCIWTRQNINEFRDLWWSKSDFSSPKKITNINPQQENYNWGSLELIEWENYEGKNNKGLLYLPDNYNPNKEYPMLVQFYETHTEEKNIYNAPMLSAALADPIYFTSNGYIVFMPDVHFTVGTPGKSSYDAVISGVNYLIDKGFATPGKIGLQGHSWSGYQTSYLVTKTNMFTCANISAPITDMVSGYLGIRNGSGLPRYFMYEETQSRMGSTLWEAKDKYLSASAITEADKIETPLLIMHNDNDEAVAYEQGRALYLAMRRLQKPAWLLNYKGDRHFIGNQSAQKDWTIRMMQFFDYYLKNTDEPRWMKEGIHLRERGIEQKYDLVK